MTLEQFSLEVGVDPFLIQKGQMIHQKIAEFLTSKKMLPPRDRINYFRNLYNESSPPVIGWGAYVIALDPVEGGLVATLRINAKHEHFADNACLIERYLIIDGRVRYLGATPVQAPRFIIGF